MSSSPERALHASVRVIRDMPTINVDSYHGKDRVSIKLKPCPRPDIVTVHIAGVDVTVEVDALISGLRAAQQESRAR